MKARPDLRFYLLQIPVDLRRNGSLEELSYELEGMGAGNALRIRQDALQWFGECLVESIRPATDPLAPTSRKIVKLDAILPLWISAKIIDRMSLQSEAIRRYARSIERWISEGAASSKPERTFASPVYRGWDPSEREYWSRRAANDFIDMSFQGSRGMMEMYPIEANEFEALMFHEVMVVNPRLFAASLDRFEESGKLIEYIASILPNYPGPI